MVKRAKLTLDHQTVVSEGVTDAYQDLGVQNEAQSPGVGIAQEGQPKGLWKVILLVALTLVSLVIFQRRIF